MFDFFVAYKNNENVAPFCVLLPKTNWYVKNFDLANAMSSLVKDEQLLVKRNKISSITKSIIKRKIFDSDLVFDNKYLKTKIKP